MGAGERLIVVSNRLPLTIEAAENELRLQPSCGGLVSALLPIFRQDGGIWIGSTGTADDARVAGLLKEWCASRGYSFEPVFLSAAERACFYQGCSNQVIWPLFHGVPSRCKFGPAYWGGYCNANRKFAEAVERVREPGDVVWVHDYHLMMVAEKLRSLRCDCRLAYFHHIPFPCSEIFQRLPWRVEVLRGLMQFDLLGFQTLRDRRNFVDCLRQFLPGVHVRRTGAQLLVRAGGRCAAVGNFPVGVDFQSFAAEAASARVTCAMEEIQQGLAGTQMILGVDRLDYTKGIPERLLAFETLLQSNAELQGRVTLVQIVVPSREEIPEYDGLKLRIETLVSEINGEYSSPGWVPIHYLHRSVSRAELVAFFRAAWMALVTPLRDGMNLVAKEFCASRINHQGVLVLSEFAGAAEELRTGALLVNPYHTLQVAAALLQGLRMSESEQRARMERMRSHLRVNDVFHWAKSFRAANHWLSAGWPRPAAAAVS